MSLVRSSARSSGPSTPAAGSRSNSKSTCASAGCPPPTRRHRGDGLLPASSGRANRRCEPRRRVHHRRPDDEGVVRSVREDALKLLGRVPSADGLYPRGIRCGALAKLDEVVSSGLESRVPHSLAHFPISFGLFKSRHALVRPLAWSQAEPNRMIDRSAVPVSVTRQAQA